MTARPRKRDMRAALLAIGGYGCESFTRGHCEAAGRSLGADFTADAWCAACIANAALNRPRGRESYAATVHCVPVAAGPGGADPKETRP